MVTDELNKKFQLIYVFVKSSIVLVYVMAFIPRKDS